MEFLKKFFGKPEKKSPDDSEQAVIVYLKGSGLPSEVYDRYDLSTIEDKLSEVLESENLGDVDGNEVGPEGATIYMYGADADRLFGGVEAILREYPLCAGARVVIRNGPPGAVQKEVIL